MNWVYNPVTGGHFTTGGLTTIQYSEVSDSFTYIGKGMIPEDNNGSFIVDSGTVYQEIFSTNGLILTFNSTAGINLATHAGIVNSVVFSDGVESATLAGALSQNDVFGHTTVGDYFQDPALLNGADTLTVSDSTVIWHGFAGADKITGNTGNDTLYGDDGTNTSPDGNDTLTGLGGDDFLSGGLGNDILIGGDGNDSLDGGAGNDTMTGGLGNDAYFVDSTLDKIVEGTDVGHDAVTSSVSLTLAANVEDLTLKPLAGDINATGNALVNILTGNEGNNRLDGVANTGGTGDTLIGGLGNDTYILHSGSDVVLENASEGNDTVVIALNNANPASPLDLIVANFFNVENITVTGTGLFNLDGDANSNILIGNASANSITGGGGNDTMDGGAGADSMIGGLGNDTYTVDNAGDSIFDPGGNNAVFDKMASGTYVLQLGIDSLTMLGTAALHVTGNGHGDTLTGNSGANVIDGGGGGGVDTMAGGLGADTYFVDNSSDLVTEAPGTAAGIDLVNSNASFDLSVNGLNVEKLTLTGIGNVNATGNDLANTITGNVNDNTLDGGHGVDTLAGGLGDDTYIVDVVSAGAIAKLEDVVTDTGGTDTLELRTVAPVVTTAASTTFTLGATLENFDISGTQANHFNITGNAFNNHLTGNDWDNTLNGGAGADTMIGGLGNDSYIFDNIGDVAVENLGEGSDTVIITYAAAAGGTTINLNDSAYINVENLTITGKGLFDLDGTIGDNTLTGNASVNHMNGGDGNDTYVVGAGDIISELPGQGTDTVIASVNWSLANDFENLTLSGTALAGAGNSTDNIITGNASANTLTGNDGNDTLIGGLGADKLFGSNGNDTLDGGAGIDTLDGGPGLDVFVFHAAQATSAANADVINNFAAGGGGDTLDIHEILQGHGYGGGTLVDYVHLTASGANVIVSVDADGGSVNGAHFINVATLTGFNLGSLGTVDVLLAQGNILA